MALFGKNPFRTGKPGKASSGESDVVLPALDPSVLRRNNLTLLTIDERWTSLFTGQNLPPSLLVLQNEMSEVLKKQARLNEEMDNLEPTKKKAMNAIIRLTKEAFEDGDEKAKVSLTKSRDEIEKLNLRWSGLMEERDAMVDGLRDLNLRLLHETARHVFSTLREAQTRVPALDNEIRELEAKTATLRQERERFALDWGKLSEPFSQLYGTAYVQQLEAQFAQEIQASRAWREKAPERETGQVSSGKSDAEAVASGTSGSETEDAGGPDHRTGREETK